MAPDRQQSLLTSLAPVHEGALAGFHPAVGSWFAARRLGFAANGIHALPGPSWRRIKRVARRLSGQ